MEEIRNLAENGMERVEESMLHFHPFPQRKNKNDTVQTKVLIFLFNEKKSALNNVVKTELQCSFHSLQIPILLETI